MGDALHCTTNNGTIDALIHEHNTSHAGLMELFNNHNTINVGVMPDSPFRYEPIMSIGLVNRRVYRVEYGSIRGVLRTGRI